MPPAADGSFAAMALRECDGLVLSDAELPGEGDTRVDSAQPEIMSMISKGMQNSALTYTYSALTYTYTFHSSGAQVHSRGHCCSQHYTALWRSQPRQTACGQYQRHGGARRALVC